MNLLNNAIKFTPAGRQVELTLRGRKVPAAYVKDAGIGIHPSETEDLPEILPGKTPERREAASGWGLGLSIATEIVRAHKGEIAAMSLGLGKGSTFYFKIPV